MSNVEFSEEEAYKASLSKMEANHPVGGLQTLPIRLGLAKDETGANIILIGISILVAILALSVFYINSRNSAIPTFVPPGELGAPGMPNEMLPSPIPSNQ